MKYEEVRNILTLLRANYPQSFAYYTDESSKMLLDIWYEGLKGLDSATVKKAVTDIILNDTREYAPNVAQIRKKILESHTNNSDAEALDAWRKVKDFMRLSNHDSSDAEAYHALPETVQFIYTMRDLQSMAMNRSSDNDTYEKPRFLKMYRQLKETAELRIMEAGGLPQLVSESAGGLITHE